MDNKNPKNTLGETRQFSVPRTTADSLREQINRSNEQSLHRKRLAENAARQVPGAQPAPAAKKVPEGVQSAAGNRPLHSRPVPSQTNGVPPAGAVSRSAPSANTANSAARPIVDPANGMPQRTAEPRPVQRMIPQQAASQPKENRTAPPMENRKRDTASALPTADPTVRRNPGPTARAMDKTRVTDISAISNTAISQLQHTAPRSTAAQPASKKPQPKKRPVRTEVVYEDEGGNTIVSMVKAVVYMIFVVVISVFLAITMIQVGNDVFAFVKNDVAVDIRIPEYATLDDVTNILYEADIIEYPQVFKIYAQLRHDNGNYLAGDYVVSPNMNYDDLRDAFKPQPKLGISQITIPEGYTTDEIIDLMVSYGIGTREGYEDVIQNYDFDYWFLEELEEGGVSEDRIYRLDGYLFPDTYQFYNASSEKLVIDKLLKRFGQIFTEEYKIQCETMGYTVDQIISLAALIEKEAGTPSEFFKVSSVFHNRLKNRANFPYLESDATIVYAIQHETGERPQLKDTSYETPYNTYHHKGLPPGPIANPSASAMLAALSPADTGYYYFVSDGNITYFSETKEQHDIFIREIRNGTIASYVATMGTEEEETTAE